MEQLTYTDGVYRTEPGPVSWWGRVFPSLTFYPKFLDIIWRASLLSQKGLFDNPAWCHSSMGTLRALEGVGGELEITGIHHLAGVDGPCVIIANHMSMLETVILPVIIQPVKDVTFVVKQGLLEYPIFRHVMRSRDPVAVTRTHPREDFKAVREGGKERLGKGISIVVFPQTTRTTKLELEHFNSIGVKLAQQAQVPIVPLALKTDAWQNGRVLKDFGKIDISRRVHFAFGEPLAGQVRGGDGHRRIVEFIRGRLAEWG
jgi:1-acyl-sn-glycerol-3-phosphate acyltransferase